MANWQKVSRGAAHGLIAHCMREKGNFGKNVNTAQSALNTYYSVDEEGRVEALTQDGVAYANYTKRLDECYQAPKNYARMNTLASLCVTAPATLRADEEDRFFEECVKFAAKRYGAKNIVCGTVHRDEQSRKADGTARPHIHILVVPAVADKKRGGEKISCKEFLNRKEMQSLHKDLETHMRVVFGRDVGITNGTSKDAPRRTLAQYKLDAETAKREAEKDVVAISREAVRIEKEEVAAVHAGVEKLRAEASRLRDRAEEEIEARALDRARALTEAREEELRVALENAQKRAQEAREAQELAERLQRAAEAAKAAAEAEKREAVKERAAAVAARTAADEKAKNAEDAIAHARAHARDELQAEREKIEAMKADAARWKESQRVAFDNAYNKSCEASKAQAEAEALRDVLQEQAEEKEIELARIKKEQIEKEAARQRVKLRKINMQTKKQNQNDRDRGGREM